MKWAMREPECLLKAKPKQSWPDHQVHLAIGVKPSHTPADAIKRQYAFDILGDADTAGKLLEGITNAFEAAYRI